MILLEDHIIEQPSLTEERVGGQKVYYMRGTYARSNFINENKRNYRKTVLEKALNEALPSCKAGGMVGELDHPPTPKINVEKISHKVTDLKMDGDNIIGESEVLDTPAGMILQKLFERKVRLGVSSRGYGTVTKRPDGINEVNDNYKLVTFDVVVNPSAKAFPNAVYEGNEYIEVWNLESIIDDMFKEGVLQ